MVRRAALQCRMRKHLSTTTGPQRLLYGTVVGVAVALAPWPVGGMARGLAGWCAGVLVYQLLTWWLIETFDARRTRERAQSLDQPNVMILVSMLVVALVMTPALTGLVAGRRFPALERRHGASMLQSVLWSVGATAIALVALVLSVPLWLVPPLVLLIPPLIWGWLTYRVMAFDALATHASTAERKALFRRHGGRMLAMGIVCGYLGAAPGLVWAAGALFFAAFFPVLLLVAVWIYTLVFAFSSLWFLHYGLSALQELRATSASTPAAGTGGRQPLALPDEPADHSPPHRTPV